MPTAGDPRTMRLGAAGFSYDERLDVWFNVAGHRALSGTSMRDQSEAWLIGWLAGRQRVQALPSATGWASSVPSDDTRSRSPLA